MKSVKRLVSAFLLVVLTLSLCGCMDFIPNRETTTVLFEAQITEDLKPEYLKGNMVTAQSILLKRLKNLGYKAAKVVIVDETYLEVTVPGKVENIFDLQPLGNIGLLEFRDPDGNVGLTGSDIKEAEANYGPLEQDGPSQHYVSLTLKPDAVAKFTEMTKKAATRSADQTNFIAIVLDGEVQSAPFVSAEYAATGINTEEVSISLGDENSSDDASNLASIINSTPLPFELKIVEK